MDFDAIILAGGRARRLAGADKPASLVGGRRLIDIALAAVADAGATVVVGPERDLPEGVLLTREDPPFTGPVAALAAGFAALGDIPADRDIAVLAADLPFLTTDQVAHLAARRAATGAPVALALDDAGHRQYLVGVWQAGALRAALHTAGDSMRSLIPADALGVPLSGIADVDTPADLAAARRRHGPADLLADALAALHPVPSRELPLDDTLDAVLAGPLRAMASFPAFDTAAMDGYAVRGPGPWRITGAAVRAGHGGGVLDAAGTAVPIATGAPLPTGAERTIRFEEVDTRPDGRLAEVSAGRDDTRRRGSSWQPGEQLAATGTRVDAALIGTARAAATDRLSVRGPLRATVHTSGDEVGSTRPSGIADTASAPVCDLAARCGARVHPGEHLGDSAAVIAAAVGPARVPGDLVVVIGATGRGTADHLRAALADTGATVLLDGLPLRPGGSLLIAALADGGVLLGLGGNPVAALAGAALCLPALRDALLAAVPERPQMVTLDNAADLAHPELWRVVPARPDGAGQWLGGTVESTAHLRSLIGASALVLIPPGNDGPARRLT